MYKIERKKIMNEAIRELAANPTTARRCSEIKQDNARQADNWYRNKFMSDRDRILYCTAFLRLAGKTQVYAPHRSDHQRTRLTHTLEVSQIARTISKALGLDCELTEAIALGHDIGHTPFGHAGERLLHEILSPTNDRDAQIPKTTPIYGLTSMQSQEQFVDLYGFKHNLQSVRCVIEDLDSRGEKFGLNLTNYTLWGIAHHSSLRYRSRKVSTNFTEPKFYDRYKEYLQHPDGHDAWSFEAMIVAEADEIAQMHHDLEDAIRQKAIFPERGIELVGQLNELSHMSSTDKEALCALRNEYLTKENLISNIARIVVNALVTTLIEASKRNLELLLAGHSYHEILGAVLPDHPDAESLEGKIKSAIGYDSFGEKHNAKVVDQFKEALSVHVLNSFDVQRTDSKGRYIIKNIFEAYYTNPQQLPDSAIRNMYLALHDNGVNFELKNEYFRMDRSELRSSVMKKINEIRRKKDIANEIWIMRVICDYIAGMTDSFAISEYEKLYG